MAAGDGYKVGRQFKIYIKALGAADAGAWQRVTIAKNPKLGIEWDEAVVEDDASTYKRYLKGLLDTPLELTCNLKVGDANYVILRTAALAPDSYIGVAISTGVLTEVGAQVFTADWIVTGFPLDAPISETVAVPITLKLAANSSYTPALTTVV